VPPLPSPPLSLIQGLVVPVIRGVEGMNFADIEKTINMLGEKVTFLIPLKN